MGFYPYNQVKIEMVQTDAGRSVRAAAYDPILAKWNIQDFAQDMKGNDFGRRRAIDSAFAWITERMMVLEM